MDKEQRLKEWGFEGRMSENVKRGAYVTSAWKELLAEAAWQSYRKNVMRKHPKPMTGAQRKNKHDLLASLRSGIESATLLVDAFPDGKDRTAWFKEADLRRVLDPRAVREIVSLCVTHFGREYADAILAELHSFYANEGEELQVVRGFGPWRTHDLLGIPH